MKRILCILSSLHAGGAETFIMKIARCLPAEEYQLDFIVSKDDGDYTQEVLNRGGRIYAIAERHQAPLKVYGGIRRIVREQGYDYVLKLGTSPVAVLDLIAARLGGARRLAARSCNAPTGVSFKHRCINAALRPVLNRVADVKLAPSRLAAEFTFGQKAADRDVILLNNGVDLNVYRYDGGGRERVRREFDLENKLVIGHIGRFFPQKNHRFLLDVFAALRKLRPDAVLLLVGAGELEQQIRGWVRELSLEDAVIFAGMRFDIPQVLSAMDVFLFPSLYEGMPNTVIEAQATGLPCILADTITRDADITGLVRYLSLNQSPEDWAGAVLDAVTPERKNVDAAFLEKGYDIQSVARQFVEIICGS